MEKTKDPNASLKKEEVYKNALNEISNFKDNNEYIYDKYMETGKMYFKQFDTSFDISDIDQPTGNFLDRMGDNLTNSICWIIGVSITYIGAKVTYNMIKKSSGSLGNLFKKLSNNKRFLGIVLTFFGVFIIGLDLYMSTKNQDAKEAQIYIKKGLNTKSVVSSLSTDFINLVKTQEISIGGMIKKMVLSIMGILDLTYSTIKRILERAIEKPIVQFGLVLFVVGLYMTFQE